MPQGILPIFPSGNSIINEKISFEKIGNNIVYYNYVSPIFSHALKDKKAFRVISSQLYINGLVSQADISRAFGVSKISIKRYVKLYREEGIDGFYKKRNVRGAAVLTPLVLDQCQSMLDEGKEVPEIASRLSLKRDTLNKAIKSGKLNKKKPLT